MTLKDSFNLRAAAEAGCCGFVSMIDPCHTKIFTSATLNLHIQKTSQYPKKEKMPNDLIVAKLK